MRPTEDSARDGSLGIAHRLRAQWAAFSFQGKLVCLGAVAVFALPLLLDLALSPPARAFGMVAADTFYYLVIGRNLGLHGMPSFDGEHLTNGFQPLWQAIVATLYALRVPGTGNHAVLYDLVILGVLCIALALVLLALSYRRRDGSLNLLFTLLPVGAYALIVCPKWLQYSPRALHAQNPFEGSEPVFGTLWSAVNGMETPLVLLAFVAVMLASLRLEPLSNGRHATAMGLLLAGLALARLDHVFLSITLWLNLVLFAPEGRGRSWWRSFWKLSLAFALPLALDLAVNRLVFGSTLPVSGRVKTSAPHVTMENARHLARYLTSWFGAPPMRLYISWRVYQQVLPAIVALLSPIVLLRFRMVGGEIRWRIAGPNANRIRFLLATAAGIVLLAIYNFFFVRTFGQGHWYFPVSILFVSLVVVEAIERWRDPVSPTDADAPPAVPLRDRRRLSSTLAVLVCVAAGVLLYLRLHRQPDYHAKFADFYFDEAPALRASFAAKDPKLFCFDDGIVAFASGFHTMSGTGLALDAEAVDAHLKGSLADLALARGYRYLTSAVYVDYRGVTLRSSPEELRNWAWGIPPFNPFSKLPMRVAYRSRRGNFAMVEVLSAP